MTKRNLAFSCSGFAKKPVEHGKRWVLKSRRKWQRKAIGRLF